jgi:transcription-repair coupling factor (superfamily II helicase)
MATSPSHITVGGAPEGFDARLILKELETSGAHVLHVARDDRRLVAMREALRFFDPTVPVFEFPAWDALPFDRVSPNPEIAAQRMATLAALTHGMPERFVLLTTLNAVPQRRPRRTSPAP